MSLAFLLSSAKCISLQKTRCFLIFRSPSDNWNLRNRWTQSIRSHLNIELYMRNSFNFPFMCTFCVFKLYFVSFLIRFDFWNIGKALYAWSSTIHISTSLTKTCIRSDIFRYFNKKNFCTIRKLSILLWQFLMFWIFR